MAHRIGWMLLSLVSSEKHVETVKLIANLLLHESGCQFMIQI